MINASTKDRLKAKLKQVPEKPGVYTHKGSKGEVIYVGKALRLKTRLKNYFGPTARLPDRTRELVSQIAEFDYLLTNSEQEALLLENTLIKRYQPFYNSRLKDDKSFPYIKFDLGDEFPRVYVTRRTGDKKARYFGPYASPGSVHRTLKMLKKTFPYRSCTKNITGRDHRPCLEYFIKRCVAPCTGYADKEAYGGVIEDAMSFLEFGSHKLIVQLRKEMSKLSKEQDYEKAASIRDRIRDLENLREKQEVADVGVESFDVIAGASDEKRSVVKVLFVRGGNLIGHDQFEVTKDVLTKSDENDQNATKTFISHYYSKTPYLPSLILTYEEIENPTLYESILESSHTKKVKIVSPIRGGKKRLATMAKKNATQALKEINIKSLASMASTEIALAELQRELSLPTLPVRIECYDVSHIQGSFTVASMAVFENALPKPADYRKFKIKMSTNNDFFAMYEVLLRRFKKLGKDAETLDSFAKVPDLILIDGGKGQLSSAKKALLDTGKEGLALAAIAKKEELIFVPDEDDAITLPFTSPALKLVQNVRDEAHRFAVSFHRSKRQRYATRSALDDVPEIGLKRKQAILRAFGSIKAIREANENEIAAVPGMTTRLARVVKERL